jgi:hypothetical protein
MLLIGTKDLPKTLETGDFFCPVCDRSQAFFKRSTQPYLTVYFIPFVPIGVVQHYVQCQNCHTSFEPTILGDPTPDSERSFEQDMLKIAALTMVEDDQVTEPEIRMALEALRMVAQVTVTREELGQVCSEVRSRQLRLNGFLWTARQRLAPEQRPRVIELIFLISGAEGSISPRRLQSLVQCQSLLEMTTEQFEQAIIVAEKIIENSERKR